MFTLCHSRFLLRPHLSHSLSEVNSLQYLIGCTFRFQLEQILLRCCINNLSQVSVEIVNLLRILRLTSREISAKMVLIGAQFGLDSILQRRCMEEWKRESRSAARSGGRRWSDGSIVLLKHSSSFSSRMIRSM